MTALDNPVPVPAPAAAPALAEVTRRRLTPKQAAVVARLIDAAAAEARDHGYEGMTVRGAARRAGVAPATAYTYFASKDHLLAEVIWRRLEALPEPAPDPGTDQRTDPRADVLRRVAAELSALSLFMADDTTVAAACTTALLGSGPDLQALRVRFSDVVNRRLSNALGAGADPAVLEGLGLAWSGAMLWAGMGHMSFAEIPSALTEVARLLLRDGA